MITSVMTPELLIENTDTIIKLPCRIHKIRRASGIIFIMVNHGRYIYQAVYMPEICKNELNELCEGAYIEMTASVKREKRAEHGVELTISSFKVLSKPCAEFPFSITQPNLTCNITENINNRVVALRHPKELAVMNILSGVKKSFRSTLENISFAEITTPKISTIKSLGTEYISLHYFGNKCSMSMTSQYYKQMALAAMTRVYEISSSFSDVNRNSTRHLNEYTTLDFELAYTSSVDDIIKLVTLLINNCIDYINNNYSHELKVLGVSLIPTKSIPLIAFTDIERATGTPYNDINPAAEAKLTSYAQEFHNCDSIFVTDLPSLKQPFYAQEGKSFVLISNGATIASGSENIFDYNELIEAIRVRGLNADNYKAFTDTFRYGMPPHGGASIGIERFVMKLLKLDNIREASMFPRDLHHITP